MQLCLQIANFQTHAAHIIIIEKLDILIRPPIDITVYESLNPLRRLRVILTRLDRLPGETRTANLKGLELFC